MTYSNTQQGKVKLEYFGHAAFLWTTVYGQRILIDPYGNPFERTRLFPSFGTPASSCWFKASFPNIACDMVLITHPHFDHDAVERVKGAPTIVRSPVELLTTQDLSVRGFMGKHAGPYGREFDQRNVVFIVETAGITFCHIGDNRAELPPQMRQAIKQVDVLMVPVDDSNHLLSYEQVVQIIGCVKPAVVIPMHYFIPGLTDASSTLGGIEHWISTQQNVRYLNSDEITLSTSDIPKKAEVWVFDAKQAA